MLFILEHNKSIMGNMKSIIGKNFWKFPKACVLGKLAYLTEAYSEIWP